MLDILQSTLGIFWGGLALLIVARWWITPVVQSSPEAKAAGVYLCLKEQRKVNTDDAVMTCADERSAIKNS
jgi:hypothetical protein